MIFIKPMLTQQYSSENPDILSKTISEEREGIIFRI